MEGLGQGWGTTEVAVTGATVARGEMGVSEVHTYTHIHSHTLCEHGGGDTGGVTVTNLSVHSPLGSWSSPCKPPPPSSVISNLTLLPTVCSPPSLVLEVAGVEDQPERKILRVKGRVVERVGEWRERGMEGRESSRLFLGKEGGGAVEVEDMGKAVRAVGREEGE